MSFPTITITGDALPSDRQVNISIEVIEQFTEHSPARLQIRFTNETPTNGERYADDEDERYSWGFTLVLEY